LLRKYVVGLLLGIASCLALAAPPSQDTAVFAGGCFWSEESAFEGVPGVIKVVSGYTGGQKKNPTYEEVSSGGTGHVESVQVTFDPSKVSYEKLLSVFWHNTDPFEPNGQFCDFGDQYRSAIFYKDDAQKHAAEESKRKLEEQSKFQGKIVTRIVPASTFYPAEEYHQGFTRKNPVRYQQYRIGCGRDRRLKQIWGDEAGGHP